MGWQGEESDGSPGGDDSSSNDEDERAWKAELKKQHRLLRTEKRLRRRHDDDSTPQKPKFYEIKEGAEFKSLKDKSKQSKVLKWVEKSWGESFWWQYVSQPVVQKQRNNICFYLPVIQQPADGGGFC